MKGIVVCVKGGGVGGNRNIKERLQKRKGSERVVPISLGRGGPYEACFLLRFGKNCTEEIRDLNSIQCTGTKLQAGHVCPTLAGAASYLP